MPSRSAPSFLVLHALRLKGFADTAVVAAHAGLSEDDAAGHLTALAADGLASHRSGQITGWSLSAAGRAAHETEARAEVDQAGARDAIGAAYKAFLGVNGDLLAACTDFQVRDGAVNDHADPVYDKGVVARLSDVHDRIVPVCRDLAAALDRYGSYLPRLQNAVERVEAGQAEWFTRPVIDSYHTVWFELHEDLLSTLGIERSKEQEHH